jgi:hypothetical protein
MERNARQAQRGRGHFRGDLIRDGDGHLCFDEPELQRLPTWRVRTRDCRLLGQVGEILVSNPLTARRHPQFKYYLESRALPLGHWRCLNGARTRPVYERPVYGGRGLGRVNQCRESDLLPAIVTASYCVGVGGHLVHGQPYVTLSRNGPDATCDIRAVTNGH